MHSEMHEDLLYHNDQIQTEPQRDTLLKANDKCLVKLGNVKYYAWLVRPIRVTDKADEGQIIMDFSISPLEMNRQHQLRAGDYLALRRIMPGDDLSFWDDGEVKNEVGRQIREWALPIARGPRLLLVFLSGPKQGDSKR